MLENYDHHITEALNSMDGLSKIHPQEAVKAIELFRKHPRVIFATMGKPAYACHKIIYTARSFGLKWHELSVPYCFHGDMGIVEEGDLLVFVSKSGNTKETNDVARYFHDYDSIALTSNGDSELAKLCKNSLTIPMESEGSPFGYAPMISTTLYMIVLHAILSDVIINRGISLEQYARNHPNGEIGEELSKIGK